MKTKTIITATAAALLSAASLGAMANTYDFEKDLPSIEKATTVMAEGICEGDLEKINTVSDFASGIIPGYQKSAGELCRDSGGFEEIVSIEMFDQFSQVYSVTGLGGAKGVVKFKNGDTADFTYRFEWENGEVRVSSSTSW